MAIGAASEFDTGRATSDRIRFAVQQQCWHSQLGCMLESPSSRVKHLDGKPGRHSIMHERIGLIGCDGFRVVREIGGADAGWESGRREDAMEHLGGWTAGSSNGLETMAPVTATSRRNK